MDYLNGYSNLPPLTAEQLNLLPQLGDMTATIVAGDAAHDLLENYCGSTVQDPLVSSQTGPRASASHGPVAPATSYTNQTDWYPQQLCASQYWQNHQAQPQFTGPSNQSYTFGTPFVNTLAPQPPTVLPALSGIPHGYWGDNESGRSTSSVFNPQSVRTAFRHRADPTRAGLLQSERFKPYGVSRAHTVEHINAEAGPSTLVPAQDPRVGTQMLLPYAGLSESAADAATTQTNTEDNEVAEPKQKSASRGRGVSRAHHLQTRAIEWAKNKRGQTVTPSFTTALQVAVEEVQKTRTIQNQEPCLISSGDLRISLTEAPTKKAERERNKRAEERKLYRQLSQYYLLPGGEREWSRLELLFVALEDLDGSTESPGPSSGEPPSGSAQFWAYE